MSTPYLPWVALVFGLIIGSFLGAFTYRMPRGISVAHGRSECPSCGTSLTARDLVPVLSWLLHGGKCRHCGAAVSPRYPLIESATAIGFFVSASLAGSALAAGLAASAVTVLVITTVIWLEHKLLSWGGFVVAGLLLAASFGITLNI